MTERILDKMRRGVYYPGHHLGPRWTGWWPRGFSSAWTPRFYAGRTASRRIA